MLATKEHVSALSALKYGNLQEGGWGPRLRERMGYHTPDDWYEATVWNLVGPTTDWLDVGCGSALFPSNVAASRALADRCHSLTGLDPSDNIDDNPYLHHRAKCMLEEFDAPQPFDLITLRMVVEHIVNPEAAVAALARLCKPGGHVVIYTVDKWSPASMVAAATPMAFHHWMKRLLWQGEEKDTFPTEYRMNTRGRLTGLMSSAGFSEAGFQTLSDTRATARFKMLNTLELVAWRSLNAIGLDYPERCLMGVYRRQG